LAQLIKARATVRTVALPGLAGVGLGFLFAFHCLMAAVASVWLRKFENQIAYVLFL
jgi:hypothetical protein